MKQLLSICLVLMLISGRAQAAAADEDSPGFWQAEQNKIASLGDGFVVWETMRTGTWTIWRINLDGTGLKQLTAPSPGFAQQAPHISPDGKKVAYLSFPELGDFSYNDLKGKSVPLRVVNADGTGDRVVVPDARKYDQGWNRAVMWFGSEKLAYIAPDRNTYMLDLTTGKNELIITGGGAWLPNVTLTHACSTFNTFSPFDPIEKQVHVIPSVGGCQCYFTMDGIWGFWMGSIGGAVKKMHLASREVSVLLDRDCLSPERNYLYFQMVSDDSRLIALGVANGAKLIGEFEGATQSDYDIYVALLDPKTLTVISKPVRYTFDPAMDRFPDVWQAQPALGYHGDKAPYTLDLKGAEFAGEWQFDPGDGSKPTAQKGTLKYTYSKPGLHIAEARQGQRVLRGEIYLAEPKAPAVVRASLEKPREISVLFDQPVKFSPDLRLELSSGTGIARWTPEGERMMRVLLKAPSKAGDKLLISSGVTDTAQRPNPMPQTNATLVARFWPSNREGLIFIWETAKSPNMLNDPVTGKQVSYPVTRHGRCWIDRNNAMVFDGGFMRAEDFTKQFAEAVAKTGEFSIEITLKTSTRWREPGYRAILSLRLLHKEGVLYLRMGGKELKLCGTPETDNLQEVRPNHVVITYKHDTLTGYLMGQAEGYRQVAFLENVGLDLAALSTAPLTIGADSENLPWRGTIEGLALYNRALSAEEIAVNYDAYQRILVAQRPHDVSVVSAQITKAGRHLTYQDQDVFPYTQALMTSEYEVRAVHWGCCTSKKIRVAEWGLLEKESQPAGEFTEGSERGFNLEPFEYNSQLEPEKRVDTLDDDPDVPLYFPTRVAAGFLRQIIPNWKVIVPANAKFDTPSELETMPKVTRTYAAKAGEEWKVLNAGSEDDYVDLSQSYASGECGYAVCYLNSKDAFSGNIVIRSAGRARIWLNGKEVLSSDPPANDYPICRLQQGHAQFDAGWNQLMIKTERRKAMWTFACSVTDANGKLVKFQGTSPDAPQ